MGTDELLFAPEEEEQLSEAPWKVLIVDDDREVHSFTRLALHDFTFERKPIHFISAYSAAEATEILKEHEDIAIILLDVVMEAKRPDWILLKPFAITSIIPPYES